MEVNEDNQNVKALSTDNMRMPAVRFTNFHVHLSGHVVDPALSSPGR